MLIHIDTYVTPKSRHRICEDYVLGCYVPVPNVVLADGCSSSAGSHLGAMILTHAAERELGGYFDRVDISSNKDQPDYFDMGIAVIHRARFLADQLGIGSNALDATLMTAFYVDEFVIVYIYGDGVVAAGPDESGCYSFVEVSYPDNSPYYLNYWMDAARRKAFADHFDQSKKVCTMENNLRTVQNKSYDEAVILKFSLKKTPVVMIASDGLSSFVKKEGPLSNASGANVLGKYMPLTDSTAAFTSFKNYNGQFLKRRAKRAITTFEKENIYLTDDLSIGVIMRTMPKSSDENELNGG